MVEQSIETRRVACQLKGGHQFSHESVVHETVYGVKLSVPVVNWRTICLHCGAYRIHNSFHRLNQSTILEGPDGRMPAYWRKVNGTL